MMILAPPREVAARALLGPLALVLGCALALLLVLRLAVQAALPTWAVAVLAPLAALALIAAVFRAGVALGPLALDERGATRPLARRHGFWIVALAVLTGLPLLGAFSLVDPWETHYAEVAREMIERRDLISPWWGNEGWFRSKPVLTFWLEVASMLTLGVRTGPDQVLAGAASAAARPEWAIRMPAFVLAAVGAYVLYNGVSRTCGRRAGFLGGLVLLTMPGYALLSHQALTDMPLVASVAAALGFLLRALETPDEAHVSRWTVRLGGRALTLHAGHLMALAVLFCTVPQLVVLLSNHVHATGSGLRLGADRLIAGSPHACTLPGQPACAPVALAHARLQPIVQVLLWTPVLVWLVAQLASETRAGRLFAVAAWTATALGAMAKGPAALVIPAAAVVLALAARRSLRPLLRLEILTGLGVVVLMVAPWYLAAFARHGRAFTDELVMRHMLGRTIDHLHDTNAGEDVGLSYFVKQLGYAAFPWSGLVVAALFAAPGDEAASRRARARTLLFGGALFAFALVSSMGTKFHHYGLLVLPGAAMLVGLWIDERLGEARSDRGGARHAASSGLFVLAAVVGLLVARDLAAPANGHAAGAARFLQLMTYRYDRRWPAADAYAPAVLLVALTTAAASLALAWRSQRRLATIAFASASVLFGLVMLDGYLVRAAPDGGQRDVFEAYYRDRGTASAGPLVAYQLNWKGENFYSGNNVAIFITSGSSMRTYLASRKERNQRIVYFVTERGRVGGLRGELGAVRSFEELTAPSVSHEFSLVRAEL